MSKKKKILISSLLIIVVVFIIACLYLNKLHKEKETINYNNTPTIFVHGWGSDYQAEESMVKYAQTHSVTNTVVRANVSPSGKVSWIGSIKKGAKNPIIEANFINNKSVPSKETNQAIALSKSSAYVKNVIIALQKKYHFRKINFVGHSMGNLQIAYYLRNNVDNQKMPQLCKQVSIAGHYNGYIGELNAPKHTSLSKNGLPNKMDTGYKGLLSLRKTFPRSAEVLNIYGDIGNNSDGAVMVNSARSYRYLISSRARSYQEKEFYGKNAQHSQLHENKRVDRLLVKFLWGK